MKPSAKLREALHGKSSLFYYMYFIATCIMLFLGLKDSQDREDSNAGTVCMSVSLCLLL